MANVYALVPARYGSKGVPLKNHRPLAGGPSPMQRAVNCARAVAEVARIIVSTEGEEAPWNMPDPEDRVRHLRRPGDLAQDDTPMLAVVKDAMLSYPGEPDDIWLLVQPTQPLRTPAHLQAAIALLQESGADSVVSVVRVPLAQSPDVLCSIEPNGQLSAWDNLFWAQPTRRQAARQAYQRDGTVYAFRRRTVTENDSFYGLDVRPLIIPPEETCALDTMDDWHEAERRLRAAGR